ncbi:MAG: hypothetical protein M3478_02055 [Planctomycetota bacterium]|nr:hypothetical protein [Planctomycetota bacterium]
MRVRAAERFTFRLPNDVLIAIEHEIGRFAPRQSLEVAHSRFVTDFAWKPQEINVTPGLGILPFTLSDVTLEAEASTGAEMMEIGEELMDEAPGADDAAPMEQSPSEGADVNLDEAIQSSAGSRRDEGALENADPSDEVRSTAARRLKEITSRVATTAQSNAEAVRNFAANTLSQLLGSGCIAAGASCPAQSVRRERKPKKARTRSKKA